MAKKVNFTIGADPEFFLKKDGEFHSAHGIVPGTKENPHLVDNGAVQVDGMALEFNINPASSRENFVNNINSVLGSLRDMVGKEYEFSFDPTAHFSEEHMKEQPQEALILGCEPDFNAYTEEANPRPDQHPTMRTAAGHIHIGWTENMDPLEKGHFEACCMLTKQLDSVLYPLSLFWDNDQERRKMYGDIGTFRPKPYGVEYRVLSNSWLNDELLKSFVFDVTKMSANYLLNGGKFYNSSTSKRLKKITSCSSSFKHLRGCYLTEYIADSVDIYRDFHESYIKPNIEKNNKKSGGKINPESFVREGEIFRKVTREFGVIMGNNGNIIHSLYRKGDGLWYIDEQTSTAYAPIEVNYDEAQEL